MLKAAGLTLTVGLAIALGIGGATATAAHTSKPTGAALRALVRQTNALPKTAGSTAQRWKLRQLARRARRFAAKQPCRSVAALASYRRVLRGIKLKKAKRYRRVNLRLAALGPASLRASRLLLTSKRTKRCGGGVPLNKRSRTQIKVLSSDVNGIKLRVQLPAVRLVPRIGAGRAWTELMLPTTGTASPPGSPGIPVATSTYGVPEGAKVTVDPGKTQSYTIHGVNVFPAQPDPVDGDNPPPDTHKPPYTDKPFTLDRGAYSEKGLEPAAADGGIIGTARDLTIGNLQVPAAQYDPSSRTLKVLNSVDVNVDFNGGTHTFSDELGSPWEHFQLSIAASMLNSNIITARRDSRFRRCGEEMLVITNSATRAAANQLAAARSAAGIRTVVVEVGTAPNQIGATAPEIQTYIRNALTNKFCIRPSYITILGDDDLVPTFTNTPGSIPSDLPYAKKDDADDLPDVAVGRIIGNDQTEVGTAVTKIIGYETTPPSTGDFLTHATIAAQFQDDNGDGQEERTFIQFAETVRNGLVNRGVTVDRVYHDSPTTTPQKFNDGTALPADLLKPTFAWDGSVADVSADWNAGRFLMIHRDHGYSDGWGTPGFTTSDVNALTNGSLLPVLLSINCSSGAYDYDETSFAGQALVSPNGGAVGVFGDTRDSPTWHNSQLALGFVDALLPSVLPNEGPATKQRMGAALINGKLRLAGLSSPATDGNTLAELYLWHYFGDPSMQMWGGASVLTINPQLLNAVFVREASPGPGPPPYHVNVTFPAELAGQTVSLLRNGQVIGKAIAGPGSVSIPVSFGDNAPAPDSLRVAIEPDGGPPVSVPVRSVPKISTTLTQQCPGSVGAYNGTFTVSGHLDPALPDRTIKLVYTRPDKTTVEETTTTDANGNWTHTLAHAAGEFHFQYGTWQVQSSFGGDETYAASQAAPCDVDVFNDG